MRFSRKSTVTGSRLQRLARRGVARDRCGVDGVPDRITAQKNAGHPVFCRDPIGGRRRIDDVSPSNCSRAFHHESQADCSRLARPHTIGPPVCRVRAGCLGRRERAKELLLAHLDGKIGLADVASACGLSRGYFVKAFHQTTGLPPHRWLVVQRVERAKEWMRNPNLPLSMIADACGFADQSHFSRTFMRLTGVSPRRWREDNT
ncbi:helix-turn-helix domain-containing protein [Burkholderia arboris]|uniref:helix-turn-helix domain-containing protein n=1 Tax=Burkholderia arboris TaxID=488730 RepID=UPI001CF392C2|nr:AraC family transcriptional regulator [Burkholderia arboris]MCA8051821.1 AraC family transcriptional regulator [Burkholderia arboris]